MKKMLLAMFVTLIVVMSLFGYFHDENPALEIEQTSEVEKI